MVRRRFVAVLSALAVVTSGLIWSAAPASAIETITVAPSSYTDASQPLDVTINGFPTMVDRNYYVYWLDFTNMTGSNTGNACPTFTLVGGVGTPTPNGSPGINLANPTLPACTWVSGTKFRFVYSDATGLNSTSQVRITFPANSFTLPVSGEYGVAFTAGLSQQFALDTACLGNCPVAGAPITTITIDIDPNGGECTVDKVTGIQGTWSRAPGANVAAGQPGAGTCRKAGTTFVGFNTSANGSGLAIAPGGNLQLTGDNRLYAQYQEVRPAAAPTNVVAAGGLKSVKVSWTAPVDIGFSPISAYLVQATPGGATCVTNQASANLLECTYSNLTPGTQYTFRVQALNRAGWGEFSAASNAAAPYDILLDTISRPEVKLLFISRGSNLDAEGRAPGLREGTTLTPMMKVGADGNFVAQTGNLARVDAKGRYSWSRKLDAKQNGQPVSLYFMLGDAKTTTLTAKLGATVGLPSPPRDVKVTSTTDGITVSWKAPAKDGGSPITGYEMTSDLRAPSGARSKFVSCKVAAPTTTCTLRANASAFDPNKTYTFSVVAKTERGTSREATENWKGQIYRLNIFKRARVDSEVLLSFTAFGWEKANPTFEIQAKVGENGPWVKQGTARLDPDYVDPIADWAGMLPKSVTAGSTVFYRVKSNKGYSNQVSFRLSSSFEYSFG